MSQDTAQDIAKSNVPFVLNVGFTGRAVELARIRTLFVARAPLVALHGLSGMGKTLLALEYVRRFGAEYRLIWWLRAEDPATLAADFADIGVALRLPGRGQTDQRAAIDGVKQWLARSDRWLIIFDSAREPWELEPYLVPGAAGHVLVTSRQASWRRAGQPVPVRGLLRDDAVELLLSRSGVRERTTGDQTPAAGRLAEALGDLPLALAQAAAYIDETGTTIDDYLELFRVRRQELLRRGAAGVTVPPVATTWDIAFREVKDRCPAAADLLNLCAFLAPDDIPRESLHKGADSCPPALSAALRDPIAVGDLVAALRRSSLIDVQEDALSVHRLVQAVVREHLSREDRAAWVERAAWLVDQAFPSEVNDRAAKSECKRWLPHARAVSELAIELDVASETVAALLHRAADFSRHESALPSGTRELYTRALAVARQLYGDEHWEVGTLYRGLARTLLVSDVDPNEAKRLAELALDIHVKCLGPDDEWVARDLTCLVLAHRLLKDLAGASAHMERATAIYEKINGRDSPRLIPMLNEQAFLLREKGDLVKARGLLERALEIGRERFGLDDPDVATFHSNLAAVLEELRDFPTARRHAECALAIGVKRYGPEHYVVAMRHNNLGVLLKTMGDFEGARAELERAVAIGRKVFPPEHRRLQRFEKNLQAVITEMASKSSRRR